MRLRLPRDRDARLALILVGVAAGMVGLSYVAVPLYRMFCQATGIEGTVQRAAAAPGTILARHLSVRFDANTDPHLPWVFRPAQRTQDMRIGEVMLAHFHAKNLSDRPITGRAAFNVSPDEAGHYFKKLACFCFNLQTLQPGEEMDFPVTYFVDPKIAKDHFLDSLNEITLSYTFYRRNDVTVDNQKPAARMSASVAAPLKGAR
jgi:cytochrome c oxidase assembly protein subunit 11